MLTYFRDFPNYSARLFAYGSLAFSGIFVLNLSQSMNFFFMCYEILGLFLFNRFEKCPSVDFTADGVKGLFHDLNSESSGAIHMLYLTLFIITGILMVRAHNSADNRQGLPGITPVMPYEYPDDN